MYRVLSSKCYVNPPTHPPTQVLKMEKLSMPIFAIEDTFLPFGFQNKAEYLAMGAKFDHKKKAWFVLKDNSLKPFVMFLYPNL